MKVEVNPVFQKCATCEYWTGERKIDSNMEVVVDDESLGRCNAKKDEISETAKNPLDYCPNWIIMDEIRDNMKEVEKDQDEEPDFSTGYFQFLDGAINVSQIFHTEEETWNDCVINREFGFDYDGYVTNVGKVATIHIKRELMSEKNIEKIKEKFLREPNGLTGIEVAPLDVDVFDLFHLASKEDI